MRPAAGLALALEEAAAEGHLEVALRVEVGPNLARVWRFLDRPPRNDWRFSVKISTRGPAVISKRIVGLRHITWLLYYQSHPDASTPYHIFANVFGDLYV
jgi:hypothetical protein